MTHIFIIFHGRFPSEKAAALFVAENAKSLAIAHPVTILVPNRRGTDIARARAMYALPPSIDLQVLSTIDLFHLPVISHAAFLISLWAFTKQVKRFLQSHATKNDIVFANDLLPALAVSNMAVRIVYEVHDFPERWQWLYRRLFTRAALVIATNQWKYKALRAKYPQAAEKIIMERNGVDMHAFGDPRDKRASRIELGLDPEKPLALYTGHLYAWKGVDVLAKAAQLLPQVSVICVGGTEADVLRMRAQYTDTVEFRGHIDHDRMPLWQSAADVLVLPNTAREALSEHYTSPMKLFEYMASGRPIVASRIPSIEEVVTDDMAFLVAPDDVYALAEGIRTALSAPDKEAKAEQARSAVQQYGWEKRAGRIMEYLRT